MPLLDCGANPDVLMNDGAGLLHDATINSDLETLRLLLDRGVKVNTATNDGQMALHYVALRKNQDVVTELLNRGANVEVKESRGETASHYAAGSSPLDKAMVLTLFKAVCLKQGQSKQPTSVIVSGMSQIAQLDLTPGERWAIFGVLISTRVNP